MYLTFHFCLGRNIYVFYLEDVDSRFLQNAETYVPNYTVSYPKKTVIFHTTVMRSSHLGISQYLRVTTYNII
jgi:hypothetical protein